MYNKYKFTFNSNRRGNICIGVVIETVFPFIFYFNLKLKFCKTQFLIIKS